MHLILSLIIIKVKTSHIDDYKNDKILENNYSDREFSFTQNTFDHQSNDEFNTINLENDILIDNYSIEEDLNEMAKNIYVIHKILISKMLILKICIPAKISMIIVTRRSI